jgi:hypothetical protein
MKEIQAIEAEAETVKSHGYAATVKQSNLEILIPLLLIIAFVFTAVGFTIGINGFSYLMLIAMLPLTLWYFMILANRSRKVEELREGELKKLQAQHTEKKAALAKNHQIANS